MDRRTLLLAYGIAEWSSALDHIDAMETVGLEVEGLTRMQVHLERETLYDHFTGYWQEVAPGTDEPSPIVWARRYLADHQTELDQLLGKEDHAETEGSGVAG